MFSFPFGFTTELTANVITVLADKLSTVLMIARRRSLPTAGPALKLGQYNHRKRVPISTSKKNEYENIEKKTKKLKSKCFKPKAKQTNRTSETGHNLHCFP